MKIHNECLVCSFLFSNRFMIYADALINVNAKDDSQLNAEVGKLRRYLVHFDTSSENLSFLHEFGLIETSMETTILRIF